MPVEGVPDEPVERPGGDALVAGLLDAQGQGDDLVHPLAGDGGDEEHRHVVEETERVPHPAGVLGHGVAVLVLDRVPLVDEDDDAGPLVQDEAGDVGVLRRDPLHAVNDEQGDVGPPDGPQGPQDAVLLHSTRDAAPPPDTGGVNQGDGDFRAVVRRPLQAGVNGVAGGAGEGADDGPLLAQQPVQQRRLADVRASDDGETGSGRGLLHLRRRGEGVHDGVEQVGNAGAVQGGDGVDGRRQPQGVELQRGLPQTVVVRLVDRQEDRAAGPAEDVGDLAVAGGDAAGGVGEEDDGVGVADCLLGLLPNQRDEGGGVLGEHPFRPRTTAGDDGLREYLDAAGVNDGEWEAVPLGVGVQPVAGGAGPVVYHRQPPADDAVEECGFAHVGPPDEGDEGFVLHRAVTSTWTVAGLMLWATTPSGTRIWGSIW